MNMSDPSTATRITDDELAELDRLADEMTELEEDFETVKRLFPRFKAFRKLQEARGGYGLYLMNKYGVTQGGIRDDGSIVRSAGAGTTTDDQAAQRAARQHARAERRKKKTT